MRVSKLYLAASRRCNPDSNLLHTMTDERWSAVDRYFNESLALSDPILDAVLAENDAAGLPHIDVTPHQGKLLYLLARSIAARKILEIGTLGGYSTIWLARAVPADGRVVTLEASEKHAAVAQRNLARAELIDRVDLRVGLALETLPLLHQEKAGPFDLIFIDADKANNPEYFRWALELSRLGSLIMIDNVVRDGAVLDEQSQDPDIRGVRRLMPMLAAETRVSATALQMVGTKGYDGFVLALVTGS